MVSRRNVLVGVAAFPLGISLMPKSFAQSASFDYYIGPNGSDSNPGTQSAPWSITALNSKWSVYAGKRVGLLDGTYDVTTLPKTNYTVKVAIAPGAQGTPTVIQSVNPRQAIISANASSASYVRAPIIGNGNSGEGAAFAPHDITIKDLTITGGSSSGVSFAGINPKDSPRLVVDGCHIYNQVDPNGNDNIGCVKAGTGVYGLLINNCHLHDCWQAGIPRTQHGNASGVHSYDNSMTVQYTTIHDCNNGIYQKNGDPTVPPDGMTIRNCYFYGSAATGLGEALAGFNNAGGTAPPYAPLSVYNTVFENAKEIVYPGANSGVDGLQANVAFFNNTIYAAGEVGSDYWVPTSAANAAGAKVSRYNNIKVRGSADSARGDLTLGPVAGAWRVCDYNCWPTNPQFGLSGSSAYPSSFMTLSAWQAMAGRPDGHSFVANPSFAGPLSSGSGAAQYKLAAGSPCVGAGRVGGTSSGAPVDMGAWGGTDAKTGGPVTQIGHNFAATSASQQPVPDAPKLTVS